MCSISHMQKFIQTFDILLFLFNYIDLIQLSKSSKMYIYLLFGVLKIKPNNNIVPFLFTDS